MEEEEAQPGAAAAVVPAAGPGKLACCCRSFVIDRHLNVEKTKCVYSGCVGVHTDESLRLLREKLYALSITYAEEGNCNRHELQADRS